VKTFHSNSTGSNEIEKSYARKGESQKGEASRDRREAKKVMPEFEEEMARKLRPKPVRFKPPSHFV